MKKPSFITRAVLIVSVVSLLTDIASEMLYPVMPLYLQTIGYGVVAIGLIEGFSELIAGINKVFFARLSDATGKRKLFITIGYGISAFAKPAIGFMDSIVGIFGAKFADRLGKGVRTAPRDAILVAESTPENRGKVFGFHRSLDTLGAIIGPILGVIMLIAYPGNYKLVFIVSIVPGILALIATRFLPKEDPIATTEDKKPVARQTIRGLVAFWKGSSRDYKKLLLGFFLFALINGSNMFLLLRLNELRFSAVTILLAYLVFNVVSASLSYYFGRLADKNGFRTVILVGLLAFALSYTVLGFGTVSVVVAFITFAIYGIFGATEESMMKAWLSLYIPKDYKATGLGLFLMANSFGFLVASVLTAFMWSSWGSAITLSLIGCISVAIIIYFYLIRLTPPKEQ